MTIPLYKTPTSKVSRNGLVRGYKRETNLLVDFQTPTLHLFFCLWVWILQFIVPTRLRRIHSLDKFDSPTVTELIGMDDQANNGNNVENIVPAPEEEGQVGGDEAVAAPAADGQLVGGRLTSNVWADFTKVWYKGVIKAQCNHCKKYLVGHSNNDTSHLKNHLASCLQKKIKDGSQKVLGANYLVKGKNELSAMSFNSEVSMQQLSIEIVMHEYPLSIVDHLYFRRFVTSLQPQFQVPSRNTVKKDIMRLYELQRKKLQKNIDQNLGKIAVTTDLWTASNQKKGFCYLPAPHTADRLASVLMECLMDWNIDSKISTITLDNYSMNDNMIDKVKPKLLSAFLIREGAMLHMRCAAHILNLIVKDGLLVIKDEIVKICESVAFWLATPRRLEKFTETAKQLRISCGNRLVLDCPTRWNSTHKMLQSFGGSSSSDSYADFQLYVNTRKKSKVSMVQSELDHYLADDIVPNSPDFDILMWWKINSPKYPTLGDIAKDFLVVPITLVASESAFSSGGRLLDPHRSRLHHNTVEALMCTRSWLQNDMKTYKNANASQFMEGIFTLLEANDDAAEEENEHEDQEQPMNIDDSILEDID
ncbi:Putative AC transposase [Linum grandiflorum]